MLHPALKTTTFLLQVVTAPLIAPHRPPAQNVSEKIASHRIPPPPPHLSISLSTVFPYFGKTSIIADLNQTARSMPHYTMTSSFLDTLLTYFTIHLDISYLGTTLLDAPGLWDRMYLSSLFVRG